MPYTIIIGIVIGVIIALLINNKQGHKQDAFKIMTIVGGIFFGFLISGAIWLIGGIFIVNGSNTEYEEIKIERVELVALQDGSTTKGSFFLGSGYINGSMGYYGYSKVATSTYKMVEFGMRRTLIVEDVTTGGMSYYQKIYRQRAETHPLMNWFCYTRGRHRFIRTEIHIPIGSIITNIKLDAR